MSRKGRNTGVNDEQGTLESKVVAMALGGKLGKAARRAVRTQRAKGLPTTFKRGNEIIKRHADGREEVLAHVEPVEYTLPKGVKIIGK